MFITKKLVIITTMADVKLAGIVNVTPDSFSDGGVNFDSQAALEITARHFREGATFVDIGAESTRPGATPVPLEEEWQRLVPVLQGFSNTSFDNISIDTYKPEIIRRATREFAPVIANDVTGFNNPEMVKAVAYLGLRCIVSHLPEGYRQDIQAAHQDKPVESEQQVVEELMFTREKLIDAGVSPGKIILDPGIGFGKVPQLNWKLLEFAKHVPGGQVMIGHSNKSFLTIDPKSGRPLMNAEALKKDKDWIRQRNLEAARIAIAAAGPKQVLYLRVHDVAAHSKLLKQAN